MQKTIVLGAEYDQALLQSLKDAIRDLGGIVKDSTWGMAGSQELASAEVHISGQTVTVEAETYVGLSISGDAALIDTIKKALDSRLSGARHES